MEAFQRVPHEATGQLASQISREIVRLHAQLYGRGPTRAKTYLENDYALCVLEEIFTAAEHTLIAAGKGDHVMITRAAFQDAVAADFVTVVEDVLSRRVKAFVSQVHVEADLGAELFLFAPSEDGDSGSGDGDFGGGPA